jgi:hypothetical protein
MIRVVYEALEVLYRYDFNQVIVAISGYRFVPRQDSIVSNKRSKRLNIE